MTSEANKECVLAINLIFKIKHFKVRIIDFC